MVEQDHVPSQKPSSSEPSIWIDNDGCPRMVRDLVYHGAKIRKFRVLVVANRHSGQVPGPWVIPVVVSSGFDAADHYIVDHVASGDLVITSDIPLAARVIEKGGLVLTTRGDLMDASNIGEKLALRNLMQELRSAGDITGGPSSPSPQDKKRFADALDRTLTKLTKS